MGLSADVVSSFSVRLYSFGLVKDCDELRIHSWVFHSQLQFRGLLTLSRSTRPRYSTENLPWSALRAEPAENKFAFAKHPFTKGTGSRPGYLVPVDVLDIAAAVADEVVMAHAFRIKARGASLDGHLAY